MSPPKVTFVNTFQSILCYAISISVARSLLYFFEQAWITSNVIFSFDFVFTVKEATTKKESSWDEMNESFQESLGDSNKSKKHTKGR